MPLEAVYISPGGFHDFQWFHVHHASLRTDFEEPTHPTDISSISQRETSCYFRARGASNSLHKHAWRQRWFLVSEICHRLPKLTLDVTISTRMAKFKCPWVAKCRDDSLRDVTALRITFCRLADQPLASQGDMKSYSHTLAYKCPDCASVVCVQCHQRSRLSSGSL